MTSDSLPPGAPPHVTIIETGIANVASVAAGLTRCGAEVSTSRDPGVIERASLLVLPGVGTFGAGMDSLRRAGLVEPLRERAAADRPLLAVCLGMQLLGRASEESSGVEGLAIQEAHATRFRAERIRIPQMGWNRVEPDPDCELLAPGYAYFANSYRLTDLPVGWRGAWSDHAGRFLAAIERGNLLACQFHPELSGGWGRALLTGWMARAREATPC